jgi:type VI secretion system protein ImpA
MALREDLYAPIAGGQPGGRDLRYTPIYDKVKQARQQDDNLDQGAWKHERKIADYALVVTLTQEAIATQSKDLQLAAWLTEALLKRDGYGGLVEGLDCCRELIARFWEHLYPEIDDGDLEFRAGPLNWIGSCLEIPLKATPLNRAGHSWYQHRDSRVVGYEDKAKDPNQKKARDKALKEGKLAPEDFDAAFADTPKSFYVQSEMNLVRAAAVIEQLNQLCMEKFADQSPSFGRLSSALEEVRHTVRQLLDKKREIEPDPVEEPPAPDPEPSIAADAPTPTITPRAAVPAITLDSSSEPADRRAAVESIANASALLRKREPFSPAPYLMLRGLRWGELRTAAESGDASALEAPPTDVRRQIKKLALEQRWSELLETAETLMVFPYSRAWLDLQRFVVEACLALGPEFDTIAKAIRSGLRALLRDVPQLLTATLMDDTPAANSATQNWLRELLAEPDNGGAAVAPVTEDRAGDGFRRRFVDAYVLAGAAMRSGEHQKGFEIMREEISRQRSGRGRFLRRLQLVQLCLIAGKDAIAQPILEDLVGAADAHKIEDWEDRETVADALALIMSASKRIQGDAKEKQKYFERICRLDPVKALSAGL